MAAKKIKVSGSYTNWPKPHFNLVVKTNKNFRGQYNGALMYAHYELSAIDLKKEVVKWLKTNDAKNPLLDKIKDIHENRFSTVGKYMYILNHGGDLPDDIAPSVEPFLLKIIDEEEKKTLQEKKSKDNADSKVSKGEDPDAVAKVVPSIQDRLREKAREVAGEVEGWIDDFCMNKKAPVKTVQEFVNLFNTFELKAPHARYMRSFFERRAEEIEEAAEGKNKDLNEGYSNFSKPELKKFDLLHKNLLGACDMFQEVAKVARAPRKKKPVSHDKLVAKMKYRKEDTSLGIVSLNPVEILGAKEIWVYNTKTRKLAQYKAADERGFSVKGTGLLQYATDSVEKTLRKPAEQLAEFKKASKVKLRTFLKEIKAVDVPCNGRMSENHIILRIDK